MRDIAKVYTYNSAPKLQGSDGGGNPAVSAGGRETAGSHDDAIFGPVTRPKNHGNMDWIGAASLNLTKT